MPATRDRYTFEALREGWRLTSVGSHEDAVADREECLAARAALSESDRELILMTAWDGLSSAEAAQVLGIRPNAFAVRLHRARRRLAENPSRPNVSLLRDAVPAATQSSGYDSGVAASMPSGTVATCSAGQLTGRLPTGDRALGTYHVNLILTNTSSTRCSMRGYGG